jgi:uncharacterized membrane protein YdjX (TVP38/TMEM64 family)
VTHPSRAGADPAEKSSARRWLALLLIAAALVLLLLVGRELARLVPRFAGWVQSLGTLAPIGFLLGYVLGTVLFVPGSVLTLVAGAVFGLVGGTAIAFGGATLGATLAFLIARYLARERVERRIARDPRFKALDSSIRARGGRIAFLLRLSPVFPFNLLNYALGLTSIRLIDFLLASVGMLPGTVLYVYSGKVLGDVARAASGAAPPRGAPYYLLLGLGLAATLAVTLVVTRLAKRALSGSLQ